MAIQITDETRILEIGDRVAITVRFSEHAAADGNGAWIASTHPSRLFTRDQAITALTVAELGKSDYRAAIARGSTPRGVVVTDRLIRLTTAPAVAAVADVAAIISYQHAYELIRSYAEFGATARLLPFTVDGLIRAHPWWSSTPAAATRVSTGRMEPGRGIVATIGANVADGWAIRAGGIRPWRAMSPGNGVITLHVLGRLPTS